MKMPSVMRGGGRFAKVPTADIPRSSFDRSFGHKTTFDAGYLIPVYVDEVLPGDSFNLSMTAFARLSTPVKPIMDNLYLDSHFFFVPNRLLWTNWVKLMGEQVDPDDSISYTVPQATPTPTGYVAGRLEDYLGLPVGLVTTTTSWTHSCLPIRAYYRIWNEWFRDQNLQDSSSRGLSDDDGPDASASGGNALKKRGKRHDYFTSCLPWAQKGDASSVNAIGDGESMIFEGAASGAYGSMKPKTTSTTPDVKLDADSGTFTGNEDLEWKDPSIAININSLREAIQIQKLLERDARSGTRYPEKIMAHFGVADPSMLVMQRPEYLGGGTTPIQISPIAQTAATDTNTSSQTEQGNLSGIGTAVATGHGFVKSFTEHGIIMGLVSVRADLTYQDGMERMWSRETMYDHYFPVFAGLGEQAVLNKEICMVDASTDDDAFGYQERWAEYKYKPSRITGEFRSNHGSTLEVWHLAQDFSSGCPNLDDSFIQVDPDMDRILASTSNHHFLFDSFFKLKCARPMPMYSIPGNMDRF